MNQNKKVGCSSCHKGNNYVNNSASVQNYVVQPVQQVDCGCKSQYQHQYSCVKKNPPQQIIVVKVKEDIGPCCTDDWAYYPYGYEQQAPQFKPCKFNGCNRGH